MSQEEYDRLRNSHDRLIDEMAELKSKFAQLIEIQKQSSTESVQPPPPPAPDIREVIRTMIQEMGNLPNSDSTTNSSVSTNERTTSRNEDAIQEQSMESSDQQATSPVDVSMVQEAASLPSDTSLPNLSHISHDG